MDFFRSIRSKNWASSMTVQVNPHKIQANQHWKPSNSTSTLSVAQGLFCQQIPFYSPLDVSKAQIRLVTLLPATHEDDDIHCFLRTIDVHDIKDNEENKYEALSYTWGDPLEEKKTIYLHDRPFKVTKNLYVALRFLRKSSLPRTLWIDAICINQDHEHERNHQVRQMRVIYASASQVLVWLGEPDEDTDKAMDLLTHLSKTWDTTQPPANIREPCQPVLPGIAKILRSSWWERIWVVQEVSVATKCPLIGCGWKWVEFDIFWTIKWALFVDQMFPRNNLPQDFPVIDSAVFVEENVLPRAWKHEPERQVGDANRTFAALISGTSRRDATDPRDKIFAIVGLHPDQADDSLLPDYGMDVAEVYQRAMLVMLSSDINNLDSATTQKNIDLPSWCSDFSNRTWFHRRPTAVLRGQAGGSRSTPRTTSIIRDVSKNAIRISGVTIGRIELSGKRGGDFTDEQPLPNTPGVHDNLDESARKQLRFIQEFLLQVAQFTVRAYMALESRIGRTEACAALANGEVWQVVNGGRDLKAAAKQTGTENANLPENYALVEKWAVDTLPFWPATTEEWRHLLPDIIPADLESDVFLTIKKLPWLMPEATYFTTETGYIGAAADHAAVIGDIVVVLFGYDTPVVLRPCGTGGSFKIVTQAWVGGVMDGGFAEKMTVQCRTREFHLV
jgi:hypothetical protein